MILSQLTSVPEAHNTMTKSDLTDGYDLRSLETLGCGGAPLGKDVMKVFADRFPTADLWQVSGHNFFVFYAKMVLPDSACLYIAI